MAEEINKEELEFTPEVVQQEEAPIVAEEVVEAPTPAPKKKAKKAAPAKKAPGSYFEGRLIEAIPARLGRRWTVIIDGKRHKVLRDEIEVVD